MNARDAEKQSAQQQSAEYLRSRLNPADPVYTILNSVSRSGMNRRISLCIGKGKEVENITWHAARALGESVKQRGAWVQDGGISVNGCGMDMGFELVYRLGHALWPQGFDCIGEGCPSNDHSNRSDSKHHRDGGYALAHRWL